MKKVKSLGVYFNGRRVGTLARHREYPPAYDLTYSSSLGGEHAATVHGNGKNPGREELLMVAKGVGLDKKKAALTADRVRECVWSMLGRYLE